MAKRGAILILSGCLLAGQVHLSIEFDPCLWSANAQSEGQHGFCGHACPASFVSGWVGAPAPPQLLTVPRDTRIRHEILPVRPTTRPRDADSSRAPPLA